MDTLTTATVGARVYEIDPLSDSRWSDFVLGHSQGGIFHGRAWLSALRDGYGYQPIVYTTSQPNEPLSSALVFCRVNSWITGRRLVSLPFTDHCEPLLGDCGELRPLLSGIAQKLPAEGWRYIEMRPLQTLNPAVINLLQHRSYDYAFHSIDLTPSLGTLFANCHRDSVQRKIRRAAREQLTYHAGRSDTLLREFYRLFLLTRKRHGVPPHPFRWFRHLIDHMGEALNIRVAYKNGKAIAAILTLAHKHTITYKYGCSDLRFSNLGGTQFLFWTCMEEAKGHGMRVFDLGRSDCSNQGLITFKDRWGASRSQLTYFRYAPSASAMNLWLEHPTSWAFRLPASVIARTPATLLSAIAKVLYKHVG